jgi:peptidoglycan/LPS O-acetylase OafA/YrhL
MNDEDRKSRVTASNSAIPAPPSRFYRPELDVLRFVAFLMVYLTHTIPVEPDAPHWVRAFSNANGSGIQVFFALSAYLITELLTREKRITGSVNVPAFYARRILRIWPLYFFALCAGFLISHLHHGGPIPVPELVAYFFFVGNLYISRYGYLSSGIAPLWTITVEEQFYLGWPWLVRYTTRRELGIVCCLGWASSQATLIYLCRYHASDGSAIWTNSLVQLQYFALGAGVSLFFNQSAPRIHRGLRGLMILSALLLLFAADFAFSSDGGDAPASVAHTYPTFLFAGVAVTLMLVGFLGISSFDGWRSLRYLGKISYGLYVYHVPCLMVISKIAQLARHDSPLVELVLGLPLTIGIASISYRFFELPFLRVKERFEIVRSRAV